jgi:DnaK suppressor protein
MDKQKLEYFRNLLLEQRKQAVIDMQEDQSAAVVERDGVIDSADEALLDERTSTAFELGDRQYHLIDEIDDALSRIEDGTYGQCERCGKPISEERLKAMPTARYDAECQAAIEAQQGTDVTPTL